MPLIRHSLTGFGLKQSTVADALAAKQFTGMNMLGQMSGVRAAYERRAQAPMYFVSHDMTLLAVDTALHGGAPLETKLPSETGIVGFEGGVHLDGMPESIADIGIVCWDNQDKWSHGEDGRIYFDISTYSNTRAAHNIPLWKGLADAPDFVEATPGALNINDVPGVADWCVFWEGVLRAVFALADVPTVTRTRDYKTKPLDRVPRKYDPDLPSNRVRLVDVRENLDAPDGLERENNADNSGNDGKRREYAYRFIVRGFYRNQPYGPERKLRRRQWIPPFVKGPADKPLRVKDTVNVLRGATAGAKENRA